MATHIPDGEGPRDPPLADLAGETSRPRPADGAPHHFPAKDQGRTDSGSSLDEGDPYTPGLSLPCTSRVVSTPPSFDAVATGIDKCPIPTDRRPGHQGVRTSTPDVRTRGLALPLASQGSPGGTTACGAHGLDTSSRERHEPQWLIRELRVARTDVEPAPSGPGSRHKSLQGRAARKPAASAAPGHRSARG